MQEAGNSRSCDLNKLNEYGLASFQLLTMELKAKMLSNEEVEVYASMKDIALCDERKGSATKRTGSD